MTNEPGQLDRAWAVLSPPRTRELASFPLDVAFGEFACRVALDRSGFRHLLVPAAGEIVAADPRPSTLSVAIRQLVFDDRRTTYVDLVCTEADLHSEFDEVVADVLETINGSDRPAADALKALTRWRRLFRSRLHRGLSIEARIGLFAELAMLDAFLDADPGFPVDAWRGPLREPHDYEPGRRCVEVKGLGSGKDSVVIHGLEQMATHDDRPLDLAVLTVLADPEGITLTELIDRIRRRVGSPADFTARLTAAGWAADPAVPDADGYSVGQVLRVKVEAETPRLVASGLTTGGLPPGVFDVQYRVELATLLPLADGTSLAQIAAQAIG